MLKTKVESEAKLQVTSLSLQLDGLRQRVEEKQNVEENLATALHLADRYKGHLLKEQGHLYNCHLNFYKVALCFIQVKKYLLDFLGEESAEGGWKFLCIFTPKAGQAHGGNQHPESGRPKDQATEHESTFK